MEKQQHSLEPHATLAENTQYFCHPFSVCCDIFLHFFTHNNFDSRRSTMWKVLTRSHFHRSLKKASCSIIHSFAITLKMFFFESYIREAFRCLYFWKDNEMKELLWKLLFKCIFACSNSQAFVSFSTNLLLFRIFLIFRFHNQHVFIFFCLLSTISDEFTGKIKAEKTKAWSAVFIKDLTF